MEKELEMCAHCGVKPKRSTRAKYCSKACGQRAYEKRKGIKPPSFYKKIQESKEKFIGNIKPTNPSTIQFTLPINEIQNAKWQVNFWFNKWQNATKGIFPLATLAGIGIGSLNKEKGKKTTSDVMAMIIGGIVGNYVDQQRKESIIKESRQNFLNWKHELTRLERVRIATSKLIKESELLQINEAMVKLPKQHGPVVTSSDYKKEYLPELKLKDKWKYLMGNPSPNFYALIHGLPGNGKSTLAVQFAEYMQQNHGNVIYLASEQFGVNKSFQKLLRMNDANFDVHIKANKLNPKEALKIIKNYSMVVIDSVNHIKWSQDDLEYLRANAKNTAFLAIMQSKKDGDFKGDQEFAHNCDIILKVDKMVAYQYKSRFGPPAHVHLISK